MHIAALPLFGWYSIRTQNGHGPYSAGKMVLWPWGITDQSISWINTEHARTGYHKTCGTEYHQPYRRFNSQTPYFKWNIAHARSLSVLEVSRSLQSWVSTTHRPYSHGTFFVFEFKKMVRLVAAEKLSRWKYRAHLSERTHAMIDLRSGYGMNPQPTRFSLGAASERISRSNLSFNSRNVGACERWTCRTEAHRSNSVAATQQ